MASILQCPRIAGLKEIAMNYDALLCDVWGVVHNGVSANQGAVEALGEFKKLGKPTFLLTNAPRPNAQVLMQLAKLKVRQETTFDKIVTSGDVTRKIISKSSKSIFHIGTQFDKSLFEGLNIRFEDWQTAETVVCTGLYDDYHETPDDYSRLLKNIEERGLSFICANPDIVVEHGGMMRWCAGSLAKKYSELGGQSVIIGKPNLPVYQHAHDQLNKMAGVTLGKSKILAIGDGINTDIAGALGYGLDVVYISAGIHFAEYGSADNPDNKRLQGFLKDNNATPVAWMPQLKW